MKQKVAIEAVKAKATTLLNLDVKKLIRSLILGGYGG
jgi:hypothetical protein